MHKVKKCSFTKILYSFSQTHTKKHEFHHETCISELELTRQQSVLLLRALQSLCGSQGHAPYADLTDLTFVLSDLKYTDCTSNNLMSFN